MTSSPAPADSRDDLDTKIMRSSAWAVLGYGGTQALSLVTMLVLARMLVPEDFGVVALSLAILAVAQIVQESGLGAALIVYRGDVRRAAACVAAFSPAVALGLYAVFFVAAPHAATFFRQPDLTAVLRVMALALVLRGLAIMPLALLERGMRFRPITTIEISAGVAQAATAIALALAGVGLWSLVFGQLAAGLTVAVLAWTFSPERPSPLEAERATLFELTRFGRHVGLANLVNYGNANAAGIVIGRVVGATALGYYTIAARVASLPTSTIGNILGRGVFAAMASVHEEPERVRRIWLENLQRLALLSVPAAIGLALIADPVVHTLFGEQWQPAVVPLQLLALKAVVGTFSATSGEVFQAVHRPQLRVVFEGSYLIVVIPAYIVGARWDGITGAALAGLVVNASWGLLVVSMLMRVLDVRPSELGRAIARPAIGWAAIAAAVLAVRPLVADLSSGAELAVLVCAGASVYLVAVMAFARGILLTMWVNLRGTRTSA